ncbi:hypothetical protein SeMB42_g01263 [Synchytrium endobioticum]|uniref:Ubiquitin-conjugating enzyme E2 Z n=1 Tax=Synchytrium endobioticum TaxID=286115 RepID=A0A507DLV5_9FUNG|nr:hypothetical protein SeLEV6574_g02809 [Synchytrium endobioticum]TPX52644.1 hypothetical protein SeMB42_g01263 [Synchytrium endobioticum]
MSSRTILRLQRELLDIGRSPENQLFVAYNDDNVKHIHALITGPLETPYSLGMFDFSIICGDDYPTGPPKVTAMTTSNGKVRFNPNIYATGKICLSLLGTWRGEAGEQWSSAHGILSVLISIQSLMSDKPYTNEPGFENPSPADQKYIDEYNKKIMHETLRVSVCDRLETYLGWKSNDVRVDNTSIARHYCTCRERSPFEDLCKRMFLLYYDNYISIVDDESAKVKDGNLFTRMRFEGGSNSMEGTFAYGSIRKRLESIYKGLLDEIESWKRDSIAHIKADTTTASNIRSQYDQIRNSKDHNGNISIELHEKNPFTWDITVFGLPATAHDGALYKAEMVFADSFPEVHPRVRFLSEVFHPNISRDGFPYYRTTRDDDIRSHLTAVAKLFTQDPDPQPAARLNMKAAQMYYGSKEEKRDYNRRVRRLAQKSVDDE